VPATARTFTLLGIDAKPVAVEVDLRGGLPSFSLVGLPDAAVRESRERVRAALSNAGYKFPGERIIANLAPADLRKGGPGLDLAIAAALLGCSGQLRAEALEGVAFAGELGLDGSVRAIPGALAMAEAARRDGVRTLAVPFANGPEAALARGLRVVPISHLRELELLGGAEEPAQPVPLELGLNGRAPAGARGHRRRRSQRAHRGAARGGEVARRAPPALDTAAALRGRGGGGAPRRERLRADGRCGRLAPAAVSLAPPHDLVGRARRRRHAAAGR